MSISSGLTGPRLTHERYSGLWLVQTVDFRASQATAGTTNVDDSHTPVVLTGRYYPYFGYGGAGPVAGGLRDVLCNDPRSPVSTDSSPAGPRPRRKRNHTHTGRRCDARGGAIIATTRPATSWPPSWHGAARPDCRIPREGVRSGRADTGERLQRERRPYICRHASPPQASGRVRIRSTAG